MVRFELKKILGRPGGKIALLLYLCVLIYSCCTTVIGNEYGSIVWVNDQGEKEFGYSAYQSLRNAQKEWAGELDEEHLEEVIRELNRIAASPEAQSEDYHQNDIAFHWKMSVKPVWELLTFCFSPGIQSIDYDVTDTLTPSDAGSVYSRRVELLRSYLYDENNRDAARLTERSKEYLLSQYEKLEGQVYYDYHRGWEQALDTLTYIMLMGTLILGYLVSGIFSNEFRWKADSVYFSTCYGRDKGTSAKLMAGFSLVSILYWVAVLGCSLFNLCFCGFDGGNCAIQLLDYYRSYYNLTCWQTWLVYVLGSYIATVFIMFLCMWVSAKTKSAVFATTIPFILIFVPNFFSNDSAIGAFLALLPDKLYSLADQLRYFNVYDLGFTVIGSWPLLFGIYTLLSIFLVIALYQEFRSKQVG